MARCELRRLCKNCQSEEVEDVEHLLLRCTSVADEREKLMRLMRVGVVECRIWRIVRE